MFAHSFGDVIIDTGKNSQRVYSIQFAKPSTASIARMREAIHELLEGRQYARKDNYKLVDLALEKGSLVIESLSDQTGEEAKAAG